MAVAQSQEEEQLKLKDDNVHDSLSHNMCTDDNNSQDSSDEDVPDDDAIQSANDADSVVGISIGHAQDVMKSPTTPAVEKAQALERSRSYFFAEAALRQTKSPAALNDLKSTKRQEPSSRSQIDSTTSDASDVQTSTSWAPQIQKKKHSSLVSSMLATATEPRKRSSSGSSMFETLKRFLPDFPSSQQTQNSGRNFLDGEWTGSHDGSDYRLTKTESPEPYNADTAGRASTRPQKDTQKHVPAIGPGRSPVSSIDDKATKPRLLRRATSDNSLYLRRTVTGASQFDDYSAFANVSEMVNSRFKAITDSLQDSSIKLPKLPNLTLPSLRPHSPRTSSNTTGQDPPIAEESSNAVQDTSSRNVEGGELTEKQHPILTDALLKAEGDLVIMGGYRGSILREAQSPNRQLWVPVKVGLNLRKADLEVGLKYEDELRMEEKIIPSGTLSHIGPIDISRRLIKKCRKCRNSRGGKLKVHDWGYDWRLSPSLITERLIKFLESLDCNRPTLPRDKRGAWIVAHSLGGLVTRNAINKRPELFAGVVFAGTPQHCVNILGPLRNGDDVLLSSRVLTAQVNFTLRTSYALLPESGRCFINKETGERYDVDFFDLATWKELRLSPCIVPPLHHTTKPRKQSLIGSITESISSYTPSLPPKRFSIFGASNNESTHSISTQTARSQQTSQSSSRANHVKDHTEDLVSKTKHAAAAATGSPSSANASLEPIMTNSQAFQKPSVATQVTISREDAQEYLERTLGQVKRFKAELAHVPDLQQENKYPPHAILYSKAIPTVYGAKVASREAIKYDDAFDDLAFAAGDGVVLASAAQLPPGYRCVKGGRIESERGHVGLLGDLEGIGRCLGAVVEARTRGVGMGNFATQQR